MQKLIKITVHLVPTFLMLLFVSLGALCFAQEVDVPSGRGSGSVVAPTGWAELIAPVQQRIDLKFYGFYIGELKAPSAQFDATFRATKFLSITPSYLYYSVPADGLNELANRSRRIYSHLRGAPISDRRDGYVLGPQVRNLRAQHVCQKVSSNIHVWRKVSSSKRDQPLSQ